MFKAVGKLSFANFFLKIRRIRVAESSKIFASACNIQELHFKIASMTPVLDPERAIMHSLTAETQPNTFASYFWVTQDYDID